MIIYVGTFIDSKPARHRFKKKQNMVALTGYYVLLWLQSVNKLWTTHFILPKMSKDHWSRGCPGGGPAASGMRFCWWFHQNLTSTNWIIVGIYPTWKHWHLNRMIWPVAQLVTQHKCGVTDQKWGGQGKSQVKISQKAWVCQEVGYAVYL